MKPHFMNLRFSGLGQACPVAKSNNANLTGCTINVIMNQVRTFKNQFVDGIA